MSARVLVVDDNPLNVKLLTAKLAQDYYVVSTASDGTQALASVKASPPDLILLDVMLPILDGFEVLRQLRKRSSTPVIMLTARTSQGDRINGLNSGADDYLPKPFGPEELLARIRAVLRRTGHTEAAPPQVFEAGLLRLNPASREVWLRNQPLEITSIEFDILEILVRASGRSVTRDELTAVLYQRPATPYERSLDVHISHLRQKLEDDPREPRRIKTIRGIGYMLVRSE